MKGEFTFLLALCWLSERGWWWRLFSSQLKAKYEARYNFKGAYVDQEPVWDG
jgi:hypothetical protein